MSVSPSPGSRLYSASGALCVFLGREIDCDTGVVHIMSRKPYYGRAAARLPLEAF